MIALHLPVRLPVKALLFFGLCGVSAQAATVEVVERSEPAGAVSRSSFVTTPSLYRTLVAPPYWGNQIFTHWSVNGLRAGDRIGTASNPAIFQVYESIDAVAHYLDPLLDSDADGVPDWFELNRLGHLGQPSGADADSDGLTLGQEYQYDGHPAVSNSVMPGGISARNSGPVTVLLDPGYWIYTERSEPEGWVARQVIVSNNATIWSSAVHPEQDGYGFTGWEIAGERQTNALGMSEARFAIRVTNHVEAVARFLPVDQSTPGDGIPDYWRLMYFGNLTIPSSSDADGDGQTLRDEYRMDGNPLIGNPCLAGGISMRDSGMTLVNLRNYFGWSFRSEPPGLMAFQEGAAQTGTVVATPVPCEQIGQFMFGYWSLNGERQADSLGAALWRCSFRMVTNMEAIAHYFPCHEDLDNDDLPDWWEHRYYNGIEAVSGPSTAGGIGAMRDVYGYGFNPLVSNTLLAGGISMRNSDSITLNLQPYERVSHVLIDGRLTPWFTQWPTGSLGAASFGAAPIPALGDPDGDGDVDLEVTASNGIARVYENIGSRYTADWVERPDLSQERTAHLAGMVDPVPVYGDWTGDGCADMAIGGAHGVIRLVPRGGAPDDISLGGVAGPVRPAILDVTGDGLPDLLALRQNGLVEVLAHSGDGAHPYGLPLWTNDLLGIAVPAPTGISAADVDRKGLFDLLVSDGEGRIWEFWRQSNDTWFLSSKVWGGTAPGFASRLAPSAADLDGDGDLDLLAGFDRGGLLFLRDPQLGPPSHLTAAGGAGSVALTWEPDRQTRVRGYTVYRSTSLEGPFTRIHEGLLAQPRFEDVQVTPGGQYFYYVTASTMAFFPGSTAGALRESPPSDIVPARVGQLRLWMPDAAGDRGKEVVVKINLDRAAGVAGAGMEIGIRYDPNLLTPISQLDGATSSVRRTALTEGILFSDNASTADGILWIAGTAGGIVGAGCIFDVVFHVAVDATSGAVATNQLTDIHLQDMAGLPLSVDFSSPAIVTVTPAYRTGDVTGDGVLNADDHALLLQLLRHDAREPTSQELHAGDLNGDGKLSQRDIPLLLRLIQGKPVNPGDS